MHKRHQRTLSALRPFGSSLKVLVLAGGDPPTVKGRGSGRPHETAVPDKAFVPLRNQLVVEYVLDLLKEYGLTRIWLLGPGPLLARLPARHLFVPLAQQPGARFFANLVTGARAMEPHGDEPVLVVFADHPLTSLDALHVFLSGCRELLAEADFFHALALQASYREYGAWFGRTSVHMREMRGRASGLSLAIPSRLHHLDRLDELYDVRKLEWIESLIRLLTQLARWLGTDAPRSVVDTVVLYLAKEMEKAGRGFGIAATMARRLETWLAARVPVARLERYAARVLGAERGVRLIPVAHGGIAIDVDFAEELEALENRWDELRAIGCRQDAALRKGIR